jgi:DMSO/TMAO reductase YedYZ molybdopterin-dependent catalytic subunit
MRLRVGLLLPGFLLCGTRLPASAQSPGPALTLVGDSGQTKSLSLTDLAALPQFEVREVTRDTSTIVFRGPTLRALMSLVGAPAGHALRGPNMVLVVVADASDGYRVAYALAELDEQFGARAAILALTQNGTNLPATDGPLRVIIPGEQHHARWIRQVIRLRLVRAGS